MSEERKPRITGFYKQIRKLRTAVVAYTPVVFKYSVVPVLLAVSIFYTEPETNLLELLNPLF